MDGERENRDKKVNETEIPVEFRLEPWPTLEEYKLTKTDFMNENLEQMYSHLKTDLGNFFKDLNDKQLHKAAELITTFQFGSYMVYKRIGFMHESYTVNIDPNERRQYQFIGYELGKEVFHINKKLFVKFSKEAAKRKGQLYDWNRMINLTANEIFEIAGVEEGAHFLFDRVKKHQGRNMYECWLGGPIEEYYSSEIEFRALYWKSAYIKRYMPQFHEDLIGTIQMAEDFMRNKS